MEEKIKNLIKNALKNLGIKGADFIVEHPDDLKNGDYSTNVALIYGSILKFEKGHPREFAKKIKQEMMKNLPLEINRVEIALTGFINFRLSKEFFADRLQTILKEKDKFGKNKKLKGQKIMVEYTDPNPFKEFHIGHLMSNTVGEVISRLVEWNGAEVKRANYQGDVGIHVAKAIWGILQKKDQSIDSIQSSAQAYIQGVTAYEENEKAKEEIKEINKKIYNRSDSEINKIYNQGKKLSLEHFEEIYKKLGTKFDFYFFESEVGDEGKEIVEEFLNKEVFKKSDGAIIFEGEKYGLHTRVFLNSEGLPTYEAKELGLVKNKYKKYKFDTSISVTGNEINEYFKVLLKVMEFVLPNLAKKIKHISHGMLRLPTGKMGSRTGNVITGESLIQDMEKLALDKIKSSNREFTEKEIKEISEIISVGAIKYSILKQSIGKDIIFDFKKSLSFEGDSGPYLQYSYVRALSVTEKSEIKSSSKNFTNKNIELEHLLYRFPKVIERAMNNYAPNYVVTYLIELAKSFNNFYNNSKIIGSPEESYYLALTKAFAQVLKNGLTVLSIKTPEKM